MAHTRYPSSRPAALLVLLLLLLPAATLRAQSEQPIAYSHRIHVVDNGIDCRFCHSSAMKTNSAGIPSVEKCMICHQAIAKEKPEIVKLARYWDEKKPIPWNRVVELPDHVYFPHYRMVNAGVPCLYCHPGMDRATTAVKNRDLTMGFCLACHRGRGVSIDCWTCHK